MDNSFVLYSTQQAWIKMSHLFKWFIIDGLNFQALNHISSEVEM